MSGNVSVLAAAKMLGIGRSTLRYHIKQGNAVVDADGKVDVEASRVKMRKFLDVDQSLKGSQNVQGDDKAPPPLWRAKERTEHIRADLLQLELYERTGAYLIAADAAEAWGAKVQSTSNALMAIPARVIARIRAAASDFEAEAILTRELRAVMRILAGEAPQGEN